MFELIACTWRHGGHFGGKNGGEIWRHCYAKLERHFAIVLTANMAVWSRDCNPSIQGGVAILTKKISRNISPASINLTNRFHVAVRLFSNRSQMTSKCGKNKKVAHEAQPSVSLMFLPHFDVLCDLLLNRRTAIWNLFQFKVDRP